MKIAEKNEKYVLTDLEGNSNIFDYDNRKKLKEAIEYTFFFETKRGDFIKVKSVDALQANHDLDGNVMSYKVFINGNYMNVDKIEGQELKQLMLEIEEVESFERN